MYVCLQTLGSREHRPAQVTSEGGAASERVLDKVGLQL